MQNYKKAFLLHIALVFLCSLYLPIFLNAEIASLSLKGHLGKEEVFEALKVVKSAHDSGVRQFVVEVNSGSGEITEVLKLVKDIYALRAEKGAEVIVYINENAVGPAAILPFLAEKLYISYFVSWGDIPLGSNDVVPTNILRNTVRSLIPPDHPHYNTLSIMATAMSDPAVRVVGNGEWGFSTEGSQGQVVSEEGETLVVNHNQLKKLGLIAGTLTPETFRKEHLDINGQGATPEASKVASEPLGAKPSLQKEFEKHIRYNKEGSNAIGLIQINDKNSQISQATWIYVKSALDYYQKKQPAFVILELNTPGGEVFSSQKISDALKELDTQYNIPVVAFINNWAISAGAMLAYSCRFITVTKDASMGAAEPVIAGEGGQMVAASEKVNSALRTDFANRARFFDRNPDIAEAMVDKDIILVERFGKILKLANEDQVRQKGPNPDIVITTKGKLLTLNSEELMKYGVADLLLQPAKVGLITEQERDIGKWPADKMLLFQNPFFKQIPEATIDLYKMDWKAKFLSHISSPVVISMLFLGVIMGFYIEINTPGFGVPGSIAILCLVLMGLSSYALEVANVLEVVLLFVGIIFIALDLFLIPTFGLLGIAGLVFFFIGLFGIMLPGIGSVDFEFDTQTFNAAGEVFVQRLGWLSGTLVLAFILIAILGRYMTPTFSGFRRLVLVGSEETASNGYIAGADPKTLPQPGEKGEVMATLRPAGKVLINDQIYDAITSGEFVDKGEPIIVSSLDGSVIVVKKGTTKE